MSADYQALILMSIAFSITLHDIVYKKHVGELKVFLTLGIPAVSFILYGYRYMELSTDQIALWVFSFVMLAGIFGGTYDAVLRPYIKGEVLKVAYLMHIGLWSGLLVWSTRWII